MTWKDVDDFEIGVGDLIEDMTCKLHIVVEIRSTKKLQYRRRYAVSSDGSKHLLLESYKTTKYVYDEQ